MATQESTGRNLSNQVTHKWRSGTYIPTSGQRRRSLPETLSQRTRTRARRGKQARGRHNCLRITSSQVRGGSATLNCEQIEGEENNRLAGDVCVPPPSDGAVLLLDGQPALLELVASGTFAGDVRSRQDP